MYSFVNKKVLSIEKIMEKYRFYYKNESIFTKAKYAEEILDLSNQF
ncbi:MAG: hypothetical protein LBF15_04075 [Candidatus Peribacteria bacterium]|nr:hypothetical protein [Candidatus Peribacteria bacterium]